MAVIVNTINKVLEKLGKGNTSIDFYLGTIYEEGRGVCKNTKKAFEYYLSAALQGHIEAQLKVRDMYLNGVGVKKSGRLAIKWMIRSAEQGHRETQYRLSQKYSDGHCVGVLKNEKLAFKWCQQAALQGLSEAQNDLGVMYSKGLGVSENEALACKWYRLAAEQGLAFAQLNIGYRYLKGQGIEKDEKMAYEWIRCAAERGYGAAQYYLGMLYSEGKGTTKDEKKAHEWYLKAAEQETIWEGQHPLFWAAKLRVPECIYVLAEKGVNLNMVRAKGRGHTPLTYALKNNHLSFARILLEAKANVNAADRYGNTPLHYAAEFERLSHFIPYLQQLGANPIAKGRFERTPLYLALIMKKGKNIVLLHRSNYFKELFQPKHLQLIANVIEKNYLSKYPEDHLLERDRTTLQEEIRSIVCESHELIFKRFWSPSFESFALEITQLSLEKFKELTRNILFEHLQEFYLYKRQAEIFWKPYIEFVLFAYNAEEHNNIVFSHLPKGILDIIGQYDKGISASVCGISEDKDSIYSDKKASLCSQGLIKDRIRWVLNLGQKQHSEQMEPNVQLFQFETELLQKEKQREERIRRRKLKLSLL